MKKMFKSATVFLIVSAILSIFWRKAFLFYFTGPDEWTVLSAFTSATDIESLCRSFLTPHAEHLMPVFKILFYIEYRVFGLSPVPYFIISISLLSISAMLLYRFLYNETNDSFSSFLCAAIYSINSTYYSIVLWIFLQQFLICFIFLELALVRTQKTITEQNDTYLIKPSLYCLLSSFSLSMGVASWILVAIYYFLKKRALSHELKEEIFPKQKTNLFIAISLMSSAAIYVSVYLIFAGGCVKGNGVFSSLEPLLIIKGFPVVTGTIVLESLGLNPIFVPSLFEMYPNLFILPLLSDKSIIMTLKIASVIAFIVASMIFLLSFLKQSLSGKTTMLTGLSLLIISVLFLVIARGGRFKEEIFYIVNGNRYLFFPFTGIIIMIAPVLNRLILSHKKKLMVLFSAIFVILIFLHDGLLSRVASADIKNSLARRKTISLIHKNLELKGSHYFDEFAAVTVNNVLYKTLLSVLKGQDDIIAELNGKDVLLKTYRDIAFELPSPYAKNDLEHYDNNLKISMKSDITLLLKDNIKPFEPTQFQHLYFKMKSDGYSHGKLSYTDIYGKKVIAFSVPKSCTYKQYCLPCPDGKDIMLTLPGGDYVIKDTRLYE